MRLDQLERGVDEYVRGVQREVETESERMRKELPQMVNFGAGLSDEDMIRQVENAVDGYLQAAPRLEELAKAIPKETEKVKETFGIIEGYLEKISTGDSNNVKEFMKFMADNGYAKGVEWEERPQYDNRQLLRELQYASLGKGPR